MAAYTVTAAEVKPLGAPVEVGIAGAAIVAGQSIYQDGNGVWQLAQADGTALEAKGLAIAVCSATLAGQPIAFCRKGDVQLDTGTLANAAVGDIVCLGAAAGGLYPSADVASTNRVTILGVMKAAGIITLNPWATGVVKA